MKSPAESQGVQDCWNQVGVYGDSTCPELKTYDHCRHCPVYLQAGRSLLEREPQAGYLAEWTRRLAEDKSVAERGSLSMVLFRIGARWFAIPTTAVKEVSALSHVHQIPHRTNEVMLGLVQVRGEIHLCVAVDRMLGLDAVTGLPHKSGGTFRRMIVVEINDHRWVWAADEVFGVHRLSPESILPSRDQQELPISGVFSWGEQEVVCLDEQGVGAALLRSVQ